MVRGEGRRTQSAQKRTRFKHALCEICHARQLVVSPFRQCGAPKVVLHLFRASSPSELGGKASRVIMGTFGIRPLTFKSVEFKLGGFYSLTST
eukprot:scaffold68005_cov66-Phaeocystis_antarctica.AAC.4